MKKWLGLFLLIPGICFGAVQFDANGDGVIDAEYQLVIENGTNCATLAETGLFCLDTDDGTLYYYDGDSVEEVGSGSGSGWDGTTNIDVTAAVEYQDDVMTRWGTDNDFQMDYNSAEDTFDISHDGTAKLRIYDDGSMEVLGTTHHGLEIDPSPDTDHTGDGFWLERIIDSGESNSALGQPMRNTSDEDLESSDADLSAATKKCDCVLMEAATPDGTTAFKCMLFGFLRDDTWALTINEDYCVAEDPSASPPFVACDTATLDEVIYIGTAWGADEILINPNRWEMTP